jgi:hypothetical protein
MVDGLVVAVVSLGESAFGLPNIDCKNGNPTTTAKASTINNSPANQTLEDFAMTPDPPHLLSTSLTTPSRRAIDIHQTTSCRWIAVRFADASVLCRRSKIVRS